MDPGSEGYFNRNFLPAQRYDYPSWLYVLVYLVVIVLSLVLNTLLLTTIWRQRLYLSPYLLLASLALKDLLTTVAVVPFVLDSQAVRLMEWRFGQSLCKMHVYLDNATSIVHVITLIALLVCLYVWMRKNEAYQDQQGQIVHRRSKMHKWSIPLSWVLGLGLCIPLIGLASPSVSMMTGSQMCVLWDGRQSNSITFWLQLSLVAFTLILALLILAFPFVALSMQLLRLREPRIEGPHYRLALTSVLLAIFYFVTRGPSDIYTLMKLFHQSHMGLKVNTSWGTPYAVTAFETDIFMSCLLYTVVMIDPILVFLLNPEIRQATKAMWGNLACNKDPAERRREKEQRRQLRQQRVSLPHDRPPPILKRNRAPHQQRQQEQQLLMSRQPQIMPNMNRNVNNQGLTQVQVLHYPQQNIPMQNMGVQQNAVPMSMQPGPHGTPEFVHNPFPLPQEMMPAASPVFSLPAPPPGSVLDTSLEGRTVSPQLPPVFEFDRFKYIDTARVEPKIGYSPDKTPPKTPDPNRKLANIINNSNIINNNNSNMNKNVNNNDVGNNVQRDEFTLETLESSPGRSMRTRRQRVTEVDEGVEVDEHLNRTNVATITITGRTRSRTDLCPDVPRSKFEHSV